MRKHLEECPECRDFNADIDRMWAALDHLPGIEPKDNFNRAVWTRIEAQKASRERSWFGFPRLNPLRAGMAVSAILVCLVGAWLVLRPHGHALVVPSPEPVPAPVTGVVSGPTAPVAAAPSAAQPIRTDQEGETMLREVNDLLSLDPSTMEEASFLDDFGAWEPERQGGGGCNPVKAPDKGPANQKSLDAGPAPVSRLVA
ncbi:MAG: hypothetical protein KA419_05050 [Acidobacteria bacterium]|nr:hypothetical protein [Acidobacteriota bacterium]